MMDQADMALNLWRQLGIRKAHLISHDMGDSVLTEILTRHQKKTLPGYFEDFFQSVTFTNGGMRMDHADPRITQRLLIAPFGLGAWFSNLRSKLPPSVTDYLLKKQLMSIWSPEYKDKAQMDRDIEDIMRLNDLNGGDRIIHKTITYLLDRYRVQNRWMEALSQIKLPVMIFWGDSDAVAPMEIPKALVRDNNINKDYFVGRTMKGAGHFLMLEQPKAYAETVLDFVKEHKLPTKSKS